MQAGAEQFSKVELSHRNQDGVSRIGERARASCTGRAVETWC